MTALAEAFNSGERETLPRVIGGRYGLSSKVWPGLRVRGV
jgi:pyruvate-ferredoxin/flavodoxin oxidoreductase